VSTNRKTEKGTKKVKEETPAGTLKEVTVIWLIASAQKVMNYQKK